MGSSKKTVPPRDARVTGRGVAGALERVAQAQREAADALAALATEHERAQLVSQRTAEAVLGLSPGVYLSLIRQYAEAGGDVIQEGKARLVEPGAFVAWLRRRSAETRPAAAAAPEHDDMLSTLGLRLAG